MVEKNYWGDKILPAKTVPKDNDLGTAYVWYTCPWCANNYVVGTIEPYTENHDCSHWNGAKVYCIKGNETYHAFAGIGYWVRTEGVKSSGAPPVIGA